MDWLPLTHDMRYLLNTIISIQQLLKDPDPVSLNKEALWIAVRVRGGGSGRCMVKCASAGRVGWPQR
jgi:hypothetical protein